MVGGRDLVFPHHENERAQSQCAHGGEQFVQYWMHNGYINIDGEKMSKSLGNFRTVHDLLESYSGEVIRFALLSSQYRSESDFSKELLEQAKGALDSWYGALKNAAVAEQETVSIDEVKSSAFFEALCDDLNTPQAISELHSLAKQLNKNPSDTKLYAQIKAYATFLGLLQQDPEVWFKGENDDDSARIDALVEARVQAKLTKNWARADEIRDQLKAEGIELLDTKTSSSWRRIS